MSSIVGPFPHAEDDYRRERITASYAGRLSSRARSLFHRRPRKPATPVEAIDWYGG